MKIIRKKVKTLETKKSKKHLCSEERKVSDRTEERQDLKWLSGNWRQKMT